MLYHLVNILLVIFTTFELEDKLADSPFLGLIYLIVYTVISFLLLLFASIYTIGVHKVSVLIQCSYYNLLFAYILYVCITF